MPSQTQQSTPLQPSPASPLTRLFRWLTRRAHLDTRRPGPPFVCYRNQKPSTGHTPGHLVETYCLGNLIIFRPAPTGTLTFRQRQN